MCMCGGILEIGAICAVVGWVGKKIHKCDCECHKEEHIHECTHCKENVKIEKEERKNCYKAIKIALAVITEIVIMMVVYGVYKMLEDHHDCTHEHVEHHHK